MNPGVIAFSLAIATCLAPAVGHAAAANRPPSYAIYAEFARDANKLMHGDLNRRVFNVVEAQSGSHISLGADGCIHLKPGTYHMQGFSLVTMQDSFSLPQPQHDNNYPGYALVYPKAFEQAGPEVLAHAIGIGTPQTALDTTPSTFDLYYTTAEPTDVCVGHQSGTDLHDEVFLSVFEVDGVPSNYHVFARISITRL